MDHEKFTYIHGQKFVVHSVKKLYNFKKMATSFEVETMIRGYQEYKDIWEAEVADKLQYQR